ncbi:MULTISPECIES: reactive chlorine resistance membrane protein RclC [Myroides]|uniref:reactive chlorine resistance membrane protein RclC n=1 Tax=Myroides TaxID=76831 RepID=UPI00057D12C1|nr:MULTISPECIES: reactive chlorine resistance membrane protein RclC [Myroides]AJA70524.1 putative membrane protein [Myroides sp. A21]MCS7473486.1 reactive chlorine resistance membrane protein RclC [Myroides odoratimimus]MDM1513258.1 YkgB family protein [Myroides odoratimimus]
MKKILVLFSSLQEKSIHFLRLSICIVMVWIGGLKAFQYEADGIVPFVTNSPFMSFFYQNSTKTVLDESGKEVYEYTQHKNPEGKVVQKNIDWHKQNGTYVFSYILGTVIVSIGILVLLGIWYPRLGFLGGVLTLGMSLVTLSFLITTPEVYVPNLGGDFPTPNYGFPYLSGAGRLVLKDIIMMAGGLVIAGDSARNLLYK